MPSSKALDIIWRMDLLIAIVCPVLLGMANPLAGQPRFETVITIGLSEQQGPEYLFVRPEFVATDTGGDIYVADSGTLDIRRFSKDGHFLASYGHQGSGPGEFEAITSMTISAQQELVIYDAKMRRITVIDTRTDGIRTVPFDSAIWPKRLLQLSEAEQWLMLAKTSSHDAGSAALADQMLHLSDSSFHLIQSTGNYSDLSSEDSFHDIAIQNHPGSVAYQNGKVYHAPGVYAGMIYEYALDVHQQWLKQRSLHSRSYVRPLVESFTSEEFDPANMLRSIRIIPSESGDMQRLDLIGRSNSQSAGLFPYGSEGLIHFVMFAPDTTAALLAVEVFDRHGELIFSQNLVDKFKDWPTRPTVLVAWKDHEDMFYLINRNGIPHIEVARLVIP